MPRPNYPSINHGFESWDTEMQDVIDILKGPLPLKEVPSLANLAALETAFPAADYTRCILAAEIGSVWGLYFSNGTTWLYVRGQDHGAAIYLSADEGIADDAAEHRVSLDTVEHDPDSLFSAADFAIKIKLPGTYLIGGDVACAPSALGSRIARLRKNGTAVRKQLLPPDVVDRQVFTMTKRLVLAANDLITVSFEQSSGGSLNVIGNGTDVALRCGVWVQKVDLAG